MATEIALELQERGYGDRLVLLSIAGRPLPAIGETPHYDLDELNLAPKSCLLTDEWENYFKPMLMRDLEEDSKSSRRVAELIANVITEDHQGINCDMLVFYGSEDTSFTGSNAEAWSRLQQHSNVANVASITPSSTTATTPPSTIPENGDFVPGCIDPESENDDDTVIPNHLFAVQSFVGGHDFIVNESSTMYASILAVLVRTQTSLPNSLCAVQWTQHLPACKVNPEMMVFSIYL